MLFAVSADEDSGDSDNEAEEQRKVSVRTVCIKNVLILPVST